MRVAIGLLSAGRRGLMRVAIGLLSAGRRGLMRVAIGLLSAGRRELMRVAIGLPSAAAGGQGADGQQPEHAARPMCMRMLVRIREYVDTCPRRRSRHFVHARASGARLRQGGW